MFLGLLTFKPVHDYIFTDDIYSPIQRLDREVESLFVVLIFKANVLFGKTPALSPSNTHSDTRQI